MATYNIQLHTAKQNGLSQVRIRIAHKSTTAQIYTGVYTYEKDFTGNRFCPINPKTKGSSDMNKKILYYTEKIESVIFSLKMEDKLDSISASYIKELVEGKRIKTTQSDFICHMKEYGDSRSTYKSIRSYQYTINTMLQFRNQDLPFADMNYSYLTDFDKWMTKKGLGRSTRNMHFRNIRAAYNDAIKRKLVTKTDYPFDEFKIKKNPPKEILYITPESISKLLSLDFTKRQGRETLERARDIFMISFYLCGANLADIYNMSKPSSGEAVWTRTKIAYREPLPIHIRIEPELQSIIEKYKGKDKMFNFSEQFKNYESFYANLKHRLDRISKMVGAKINFALCRHTWATLAHKCGVDEFVISKSLGHMDNDVTGIYYIEYDWSKTSEANRKVIDIACSGAIPNSIPTHAYIREYI